MVEKLASVRRSISGGAGVFCFSWETAEPASQMLPTATAINAANRNLVDDMVLKASRVIDHSCRMWPERPRSAALGAREPLTREYREGPQRPQQRLVQRD